MNNLDAEDYQLGSPCPAMQISGFPRYKQIYEYLLDEISSGKLKPGDKIPSEKYISAAFKVSRITSKKALDMLAVSRLISRQRGKGSFVKGSSAQAGDLSKKSAAFRSIAFLIPAFSDSFGKKLVYSVETACEALGYHLILRLTRESRAEEEKALQDMDDANVAGVLMVPVHGEHYNAEILRQILNKRPLVFVDRKMRGLPVPSVITDCISITETAIRQLLDQGHRHIAFYSGAIMHSSTVEDRLQGYTMAFSGSSIPLNQGYICDNLPSLKSLNVVTRHLSEHPEISAAFTAEFEIALLVKQALAILGRSIKRNFALVTFDRPNYAAIFPEFTYIQQDEYAIGRQAVEVLHRIIQGEAVRHTGDILIPAKLVSGDSLIE